MAFEPRGELGGESDAVALHREIHVEAGLAQHEVADGAADEVAAAHAGGHRLDVAQKVVPPELTERSGEIHRHGGGGLPGWRACHGAARHHAEERIHGHAVVDARPGLLADDRHPPHLVLRQPERHSLQGRPRPQQRYARRHDRLGRRVPQTVGRGALQVGERDAPDEAGVTHHADTADPFAATLQRRLVHLGRLQHGGRARLERVEGHTGRRDRGGSRRRDGRRDFAQGGVLDHGGGGRGVAAAAHRAERLRHVQPAPAAPCSHEHASFHLHQEEVGVAARQVHHPMGDHAHSLHVEVLTQRRQQHRGFGYRQLLGRLEGGRQRETLSGRQRIGEPFLEQLGVGTGAHAEGQRLGVPGGGRRERE